MNLICKKEMFKFPSIFSKILLIAIGFLFLNTSYAQQKLSIYDSLGIMPEFRYYQLNGNVFAPDSLPQGKQIVMIYLKKDCPYCEEQIEMILSHSKDLSTDVEFILISKEDTAFIMDYAIKHKIAGNERIKFIQDKERLYYRYCKASYTPSIHIYNKKRKLVLFHEGVLDYKQLLEYIK